MDIVEFKTNLGSFKVELDAAKAPETVANFLDYMKKGQYDGLTFHRVIKGFIIQGGGYEPGFRRRATGKPISNEAQNGLKNAKYTLSAARTIDPHSATAQFFINMADNEFLDYTSSTPQGWGYAVFGHVIDGIDVIDGIERVATSSKGIHSDVPVRDVVIESVTGV